jgi:hypothetical protein
VLLCCSVRDSFPGEPAQRIRNPAASEVRSCCSCAPSPSGLRSVQIACSALVAIQGVGNCSKHGTSSPWHDHGARESIKIRA